MSIPGRALRAAVWLPLGALLAYLVSFATQFPRLIGDFYWNSDIVSSMVLAETVVQPGHGGIHFANSAPYTTVFLDASTHWLPDHRAIWIAWPLVGALLAIAVLGWTVRRMAGTWAALLAVCIATASTPAVLSIWITQGVHGRTAVATVLLGALLLLLMDGTAQRRRTTVLVLAAVIGFVGGATVVSDPLFIVGGVVPAVVALGWYVLHRRSGGVRTAAAGSAVAVAAAVVGAGLTLLAAHRAEMSRSGFELHRATLDQAHENFHVLGADIVDMAGGTIQVRGQAPAVVADIFLGLAIVATVVLAVQVLRRRGIVSRPDPLGAAHAAMLVYWFLVGVATLLAFLLTDVVVDELSVRYLVPLLFSIAALVPLLHGDGGGRLLVRAPAALLVAALVGANAVTLFTATTRAYHTPGLEEVIAQLDARGLHRGYGDYWVSNVVTWKTDGRVAVRSVQQGGACNESTPPAVLCPELFNSADDWYHAGSGPTFVLIDPYSDVTVQPDPAVFGQPRETFRAGGFTVFVYDHDLRPHMAPSVTSRVTPHGRARLARLEALSGRLALALRGRPGVPPSPAPRLPRRLASRP